MKVLDRIAKAVFWIWSALAALYLIRTIILLIYAAVGWSGGEVVE